MPRQSRYVRRRYGLEDKFEKLTRPLLEWRKEFFKLFFWLTRQRTFDALVVQAIVRRSWELVEVRRHGIILIGWTSELAMAY